MFRLMPIAQRTSSINLTKAGLGIWAQINDHFLSILLEFRIAGY